jgi:hypothetical protein
LQRKPIVGANVPPKMQALIPQPLGKKTVDEGLIEKAPRMAGLESIMRP